MDEWGRVNENIEMRSFVIDSLDSITDYLKAHCCGNTQPVYFVGHNCKFDYDTWIVNDRRINRKKEDMEIYSEANWWCTSKWAKDLKLPSAKLGSLCTQFNVKNPRAHSALGDVIATALILPYLNGLSHGLSSTINMS